MLCQDRLKMCDGYHNHVTLKILDVLSSICLSIPISFLNMLTNMLKQWKVNYKENNILLRGQELTKNFKSLQIEVQVLLRLLANGTDRLHC